MAGCVERAVCARIDLDIVEAGLSIEVYRQSYAAIILCGPVVFIDAGG